MSAARLARPRGGEGGARRYRTKTAASLLALTSLSISTVILSRRARIARISPLPTTHLPIAVVSVGFVELQHAVPELAMRCRLILKGRFLSETNARE